MAHLEKITNLVKLVFVALARDKTRRKPFLKSGILKKLNSQIHHLSSLGDISKT